MPELIFLGVGSIRPTRPGDHTALLLRYGEAHILLDAGPSVLMQLANVGVHPAEVSHVYFSHQHGDHILGSPILLFYHRRRVYFGALQVLEAWRRLIELVYPGIPPLLGDEIVLHPLPTDHPHPCPDVPGMTARLALVNHGAVPAFALRLDLELTPGGRRFGLVYSGDTTPCEAVVELARGADLLVHEATALAAHTVELAGVHTSARAAGEVAQAAGVRHLALVHRTAGDPEAWRREAAEAFRGSILIPQAGDRLRLPEDLDDG
ncbi:MAG: MBL fold metallo-hydrolase [Caldilineales bacterium]|nr:MBL fold metallo-hydrolase [Caldilineales bacterium]